MGPSPSRFLANLLLRLVISTSEKGREVRVWRLPCLTEKGREVCVWRPPRLTLEREVCVWRSPRLTLERVVCVWRLSRLTDKGREVRVW